VPNILFKNGTNLTLLSLRRCEAWIRLGRVACSLSKGGTTRQLQFHQQPAWQDRALLRLSTRRHSQDRLRPMLCRARHLRSLRYEAPRLHRRLLRHHLTPAHPSARPLQLLQLPQLCPSRTPKVQLAPKSLPLRQRLPKATRRHLHTASQRQLIAVLVAKRRRKLLATSSLHSSQASRARHPQATQQ